MILSAVQISPLGLPIEQLVLHEPPYGPDDEVCKVGAGDFVTGIRAMIAAGSQAEAIKTFRAGACLPVTG